jgi:hypothetical protein
MKTTAPPIAKSEADDVGNNNDELTNDTTVINDEEKSELCQLPVEWRSLTADLLALFEWPESLATDYGKYTDADCITLMLERERNKVEGTRQRRSKSTPAQV